MKNKKFDNGMVLGKFMNTHEGHVSMIKYALSKCDHVTVYVCYEPNEIVSIHSRVRWLEQTFFKSEVTVRMFKYKDYGLSDKEESCRDVSKDYATVMRSLEPEIDAIIGSEEYIHYVAEYWGITPIIYDKARAITPCSSTQVRNGDFQYYTKEAKFEEIKKLYIVGAESCGKTTLTEKFKGVVESAREFDNLLDVTFTDITNYALLHEIRINQYVASSKVDKVVIDSSAITSATYQQEWFNDIHPLVSYMLECEIGYYVVVYPNKTIPWVDDGTRLMNDYRDRVRFCDAMVELLEFHEKSFEIINGTFNENEKSVEQILEKL